MMAGHAYPCPRSDFFPGVEYSVESNSRFATLSAWTPSKQHTAAKRTARLKTSLTKRTVEALEPDRRPWIAWDDRLTGFGVRVQPSGAKTFVVNYRTGSGGRSAPNKRVTLGRFGRITPESGPAHGSGTPRQGRLGRRSCSRAC